MSEENVEIVRRCYDAVNRRDLDALLNLADPDVIAIPRILAIEGGAFRGHDGIRQWWDGIFSAFPDFNLEVVSIQGIGDATIARLIARGHGEGSGAPFEDPIWVASRVRHGKVIWWETCGSEEEALEAAGLPAQESIGEPESDG